MPGTKNGADWLNIVFWPLQRIFGD